MITTRAEDETPLARLLRERDLRHDAVCAAADVSRQTLSNAVHGRRVNLETWIKLAAALGVPLAEIAPPEEAARILAVA